MDLRACQAQRRAHRRLALLFGKAVENLRKRQFTAHRRKIPALIQVDGIQPRDALEHDLVADRLAVSHAQRALRTQKLLDRLFCPREQHLVGKREVLFPNGADNTDVLFLAQRFDLVGFLLLHAAAHAQRRGHVGRKRQLHVHAREHLTRIEHAHFARAEPAVEAAVRAAAQRAPLDRLVERQRVFKRLHPLRVLGHVQKRHADRARHLRFSVCDLTAAQEKAPARIHDAGDVRQIVRHDGLRCLLAVLAELR